MSTSTSTTSGITFVFVPPWMTVGANVVCVHACAWRASPIGSSSQKSASVDSLSSCSFHSLPEVDAFDETAPRVVDLRRRPVLGEPLHDLGRGDERVVGAERLRRVTRRSPHRDAAPVRTLLADDHRQARAARGRHLEAAGFGDDVVGTDRVVSRCRAGARRPTCRGSPRRRPRDTRACRAAGSPNARARGTRPPSSR